MKTLLVLLAVSCCLAFSGVPVLADAAVDPQTAARDAYKEYLQVTEQTARTREEGSATYKAAVEAAKTDEEKAAALDALMKMYREVGATDAAALTVFLDVFDKSDWNAFKVDEDANLLETGLGQSAQRSLETDPKAAVKAWELLLAKLPKCNSANYVRGTWLPIALPSTGDFEGAIKRLGELLADVPDDNKPDIIMAIGDTRALLGDYAAAQEEYAKALQLTPEPANNKTFAGRARPYIEMRIRLIGKPAPEVDSGTWLGADARPLSALKGKVVLLDYWATW